MTGIEWTNETWNPVTGCAKVSQGCKNCYAEGVAHRFWAKQYPPVGGRPRRFTDVQCHPDRLDEPLRWRKPRRVFVNSMSDLFHDDVPDEFIGQVFAVMGRAPQHTFQVLTKRPERMRRFCAWTARTGNPPLTNVWLGVSVEDQRASDERIPLLLQTPAAVRVLSCEPLLGPLEFSDVTRRSDAVHQLGKPALDGIGWVIVGGESGPAARPCDVAWVRSIVEQCRAAGGPAFVQDVERGRRAGTLDELIEYLRVIQQLDIVHHEGGGSFEP